MSFFEKVDYLSLPSVKLENPPTNSMVWLINDEEHDDFWGLTLSRKGRKNTYKFSWYYSRKEKKLIPTKACKDLISPIEGDELEMLEKIKELGRKKAINKN